MVKAIDCRYVTYGREVGESGTPHLQGVIVFKNPRQLSGVKLLIPRAHLEVMKGTVDQAVDYAHKDGDVEEVGDRPLSQKRKGELEKQRWSDAFASCKMGKLDDVPDDIRMRYYSTCKKIKADHATRPEEIDELSGEWIYGPAGCGKSRRARDENPVFFDKPLTKWWDGYDNEEVVLLDDISTQHNHLGYFLKRWCDRYSFPAEIKGGSMQIRPLKFVITSQYSIEEIFQDPLTVAALTRRLTVIKMD